MRAVPKSLRPRDTILLWKAFFPSASFRKFSFFMPKTDDREFACGFNERSHIPSLMNYNIGKVSAVREDP